MNPTTVQALTTITLPQTHEMVSLRPKPPAEEIKRMVLQYFECNAKGYDQFDANNPKRLLYTEAVNRLVAAFLTQDCDLNSVLSIGSGTGRREVEIKKLASRPLDVTCSDISAEMCEIARSRGLNAICGDWESVDLQRSKFDAVLFLYAFGLIPTFDARLQALVKVNKHLRLGSSLYFDVFNLEDDDEWGPSIIERMNQENWLQQGYEEGDVFYKRTDSSEVGFCHYFSKFEVMNLLSGSGFKIDRILHVGYGKHAGRIMTEPRRGSMFVKAKKTREC